MKKHVLFLIVSLSFIVSSALATEGTNYFVVNCSGQNEVPPQTNSLSAYTECFLIDRDFYLYARTFSEPCGGFVQGPAPIGENGEIIASLIPGFWGYETGWNFGYHSALSDEQLADLMAGLWYFSIHTPDGASCSPALRGQILVDSDNDGVADLYDSCTNTPVGTVVNTNGCSIDQLCPCDGPWKNHGEYVKAVERVSKQFLNDGLITAQQRKAILLAATMSNCGKPKDSDRDSVPDRVDRCPNTRYRDVVDCFGCSIEQLCPCNGPWNSHEHYVRAVVVEVMRFYAERRITRTQAVSLVSQAYQSKCGYPSQPRARVTIPVR